MPPLKPLSMPWLMVVLTPPKYLENLQKSCTHHRVLNIEHTPYKNGIILSTVWHDNAINSTQDVWYGCYK